MQLIDLDSAICVYFFLYFCYDVANVCNKYKSPDYGDSENKKFPIEKCFFIFSSPMWSNPGLQPY